jgi:hypothetical protein
MLHAAHFGTICFMLHVPMLVPMLNAAHFRVPITHSGTIGDSSRLFSSSKLWGGSGSSSGKLIQSLIQHMQHQ